MQNFWSTPRTMSTHPDRLPIPFYKQPESHTDKKTYYSEEDSYFFWDRFLKSNSSLFFSPPPSKKIVSTTFNTQKYIKISALG